MNSTERLGRSPCSARRRIHACYMSARHRARRVSVARRLARSHRPDCAGAAPGDLDPTFGTGGRVLVSISAYGADAHSRRPSSRTARSCSSAGRNRRSAACLRLPPSHRRTRASDRGRGLLRRCAWTPNGSRRPRRSAPTEIVRTPIDLDPGGRDVARGVARSAPTDRSSSAETPGAPTVDSDFAFVRYTPAGELDPTFSGDGIQTIDLGPQDIGYAAVACSPTGRSSRVATTSTYHGFEVVRLNADGSPDQSFGIGRRRATPRSDNPSLGDESLAVALDGSRIVVGGDTDSGTGARRLRGRPLPLGRAARRELRRAAGSS